MKRFWVFQGENWLGVVRADTMEEAEKEASLAKEFTGFTHLVEVDERMMSGAI